MRGIWSLYLKLWTFDMESSKKPTCTLPKHNVPMPHVQLAIDIHSRHEGCQNVKHPVKCHLGYGESGHASIFSKSWHLEFDSREHVHGLYVHGVVASGCHASTTSRCSLQCRSPLRSIMDKKNQITRTGPKRSYRWRILQVGATLQHYLI